MSSYILLLIFSSAALITAVAASSSLSITATPSHIHPMLTKKLGLRCAVRNDGEPVKKPTHAVAATKNDTSAKSASLLLNNISQQTVSSNEIVSSLLSIVVTRLNDQTGLSETMASVTGCNVPKTEDKFDSTFEVEGSSEKSDVEGELGYLLLTWERPDDGHAGNFTCEANALNSDKHPIYLNVSLEITSGEPHIADLVRYIYTREKEILSLQSEMEKQRAELRQNIVQIENDTTHLKTRLEKVKAQNIQSGNWKCVPISGTVNFTRPYATAPTVFISTTDIQSDSNYGSRTEYKITVERISTKGFSYTCSNYQATPTWRWLAIDD